MNKKQVDTITSKYKEVNDNYIRSIFEPDKEVNHFEDWLLIGMMLLSFSIFIVIVVTLIAGNIKL